MTAAAPDATTLIELDADTGRAWRAYTERLSGLSGEEYERAEAESWAELQHELLGLERQRKLIVQTSA